MALKEKKLEVCDEKEDLNHETKDTTDIKEKKKISEVY